MELLNSLFEIIERSETPSGFLVTIRLHPDHVIFKGHFPGYPVTPGVIFLQIVHELTQLHLKKTIRLIELPNCKFLKIINPEQENVVVIAASNTVEQQCLHVKAFGKTGSDIFFKLDAQYYVLDC